MSGEITITVKDVTFKRQEEKVQGYVYGRYSFDVTTPLLNELGAWSVTPEGDLAFSGTNEKAARRTVNRIVEEGERDLKNALYNKPTVFITRPSGIPLIGSNEYGVVDRGSNILEIKPLTGCNLTCVYCSVDEGKNEKTHDYLVEEEYLVEVATAVAATKTHPVECNIGPQGEPLLYPKIVELVHDLAQIPNVAIISVNTNGTLLTKKLIDELGAAGLTRINLSLNALDETVANRLAGGAYPLARVREMVAYCVERRAPRVLLAPTFVPGYNEEQMEGLVQLSRTIPSEFPTIGIQNFLNYPKGRNPAKEKPWEEFYAFIKGLEEKTGARLTSTMEEFRIVNERELEKPFKKGDRVRVHIVMPGRYPKEVVAAAGSGMSARAITIVDGPAPIGKTVTCKIIRDKHNIYKATIH